MKRLSLCLTVLCAAGLPLTAAALDYGPDRHMLAVETSAPSLPAAHDNENPFAGLTASRRAHDDDDDSASAAVADSDARHPAAPAHSARRVATPGAGVTAGAGVATPGPNPAPPAHGQNVLSWQSLLPGSIQ